MRDDEFRHRLFLPHGCSASSAQLARPSGSLAAASATSAVRNAIDPAAHAFPSWSNAPSAVGLPGALSVKPEPINEEKQPQWTGISQLTSCTDLCAASLSETLAFPVAESTDRRTMDPQALSFFPFASTTSPGPDGIAAPPDDHISSQSVPLKSMPLRPIARRPYPSLGVASLAWDVAARTESAAGVAPPHLSYASASHSDRDAGLLRGAAASTGVDD